MEDKSEKESNKSEKDHTQEKQEKEEAKINSNEAKMETEQENENERKENKAEANNENVAESALSKLIEKKDNENNEEGVNKEKIDEGKFEQLQKEEIKNIKLIPKQEYIIAVVHNITPNVTEDHLKEIFSNFGEVKECFIPINKQTQLKKNYAFIEFTKLENAEKAQLYMDEGQIDGKVVQVEILSKKNCVELK